MSKDLSAKKSCADCPSFDGDARRQLKAFHKSTGGPVCLRFGRVLGQPGATMKQQQVLWESVGSNCGSHGKPAPAQPESWDFTVAFPAMPLPPSTDLDKRQCTTCLACENLVTDTAFKEKFSWPTAYCRAKGKLIFQNRYRQEAADCDSRVFGRNSQTTDDIKLLPEFDAAFTSEIVDPITQFFENKKTEPHEYPTDRELTPEEEAQGIRAFRKIVDPEGYGDEIYLPVYDIEKLPENLQVLVPRSGDDEHPELYVDYLGLVYRVGCSWLELDETPALWGPPGNGKTELFRHMAWLMCLPFHRISITQSTELDDLAGKMHFSKEKGTYFVYGRLPKAWQQPGVICLDEPNMGPTDVWAFIRPLTDNSKQLVLDANEGERILRDDGSFLGMAMNPAWDVRNVGTNTISDADGRRLLHILVSQPPEDVERRIIKERVALDGWNIPEAMLNFVMSTAMSIRAAIDNNVLPDISWGVAQQIKVARALRWFDPLRSYAMAVGDYLDPVKREILLDQVKMHAPDTTSLAWRR